MKKVIALVSLIGMMFFSINTQAQKSTQDQVEPIPERKNYSKHGIGAVLSSANGKGLAYRYWPKTFGVQVSFIPVASNNEKFYNTGITGYARLKKYSVGELFLHAGVEYQYQTFEQYDYYSYTSSYYEAYKVISNGVNVGFGPGYHFELKPVSFDLFLGYGAYIRDESSDTPNAQLNDRQLMTVSGGFAVFLNL
jgi:hypothetical protein